MDDGISRSSSLENALKKEGTNALLARKKRNSSKNEVNSVQRPTWNLTIVKKNPEEVQRKALDSFTNASIEKKKMMDAAKELSEKFADLVLGGIEPRGADLKLSSKFIQELQTLHFAYRGFMSMNPSWTVYWTPLMVMLFSIFEKTFAYIYQQIAPGGIVWNSFQHLISSRPNMRFCDESTEYKPSKDLPEFIQSFLQDVYENLHLMVSTFVELEQNRTKFHFPQGDRPFLLIVKQFMDYLESPFNNFLYIDFCQNKIIPFFQQDSDTSLEDMNPMKKFFETFRTSKVAMPYNTEIMFWKHFFDTTAKKCRFGSHAIDTGIREISMQYAFASQMDVIRHLEEGRADIVMRFHDNIDRITASLAQSAGLNPSIKMSMGGTKSRAGKRSACMIMKTPRLKPIMPWGDRKSSKTGGKNNNKK